MRQQPLPRTLSLPEKTRELADGVNETYALVLEHMADIHKTNAAIHATISQCEAALTRTQEALRQTDTLLTWINEGKALPVKTPLNITT